MDEFVDYYSDVSCSVPSDEYFIAMMESAWQCPENDQDKASVQAVSYLCKEVKERLLKASRGGEDLLIKKCFNDFDINGNGAMTIDEVTSMIAKL